MLPSHIHGPNCGCKEYAFSEENEDLLGSIILDKVFCLNEAKIDSCKKVFRMKDTKFEKANLLESNEDPELLLIVPFECIVKLKTITVIANTFETAPNLMKLYTNQENVDFSLIQDFTPLQEFEMAPNLDGKIEYSVKISKFQNVNKLIIYFTNEILDKISISYICLKGIKTNIKPQIVQAVYESKPMLSDHKAKGGEFSNKQFIG